MPKVYGTPTGYQPPDPKRVQRATSTPAQQQQAGKDYLQHMVDAHNSFHTNSPKQQVGGTRPRGSSSYDAAGNYKPGKGTEPLRVEKALKDAGA